MAEYTVDMFSAPPAGHSLTEDNTKWPWGNPPQTVDPNQALDNLVDKFEKPKQKQELFKLLVIGTSIETIVEGVVFQGFTEGMFTPDVGLIIKGPLGIILANMAEEEDIPYRMFENDDVFEQNEMDDRTFMSLMKENNPKMFEFMRESLNMSIRGGIRTTPEDKGFLSANSKGDNK